MIIQFPRSKCVNEVWDYASSRYTRDWITYIIDSKYRISRDLTIWLEEQTIPEVNIYYTNCQTTDDIMLTILRWTHKNIKYVPDLTSWKMTEKWQTAQETFSKLTADCEDGAILMYKLARGQGVPANRLLLMCGDVDGGGHCWLAYKPDGYPLNFVFLDWCYWPDLSDIKDRKFYEVSSKKIYRSYYTSENLDNQYFNIWFCFNEVKSHSELIYNYN